MHTRKITENKLDTPPERFYTYYTQLINGSMKELYAIDSSGFPEEKGVKHGKRI